MEWRSYSVADFIPYTVDVYLQLLSATNEIFWPWHLLLFVLTATCVYAAVTGRIRMCGVLLAAGWCWIGYEFFHVYYRHLSWAGNYYAIACAAQGVLVLIISSCAQGPKKTISPLQPISGYFCLASSILWPLICLPGRQEFSQLEWVGLHPEPTAIASSGLVLLLFNGWRCWLLILWPALWILWAGLMLMVFSFPQYPLLLGIFTLLVFTGITAIYQGLCRSHYQ